MVAMTTATPNPARDTRARTVLAVLVVMLVLVGMVLFAVIRFGGVGQLPASDFVTQQAPAVVELPQTQTQARTAGQGASRSGGNRFTADPVWVNRVAAKTGIPVPALRAYADAELLLAAEQPGCHLGWNTLAGIGWIESQHGTMGGRTLRWDGYSIPTTILGPALDGTGKMAAIHSTPMSAQWHGDAVWEHAVGPLQFLPSTWDRWGADGDGNGVADPRDIDDAALTAGRYLCADGHDLATDSGWSAAVHSYNHDDQYVANVAATANTYATRAK